jgi:hypothetical protein
MYSRGLLIRNLAELEPGREIIGFFAKQKRSFEKKMNGRPEFHSKRS